MLRPPRQPNSVGKPRRTFKCRKNVSLGSRQRERCNDRFSATRNRKRPDRFRPDYVTPDRHRPQERTFELAPVYAIRRPSLASPTRTSAVSGYTSQKRLTQPSSPTYRKSVSGHEVDWSGSVTAPCPASPKRYLAGQALDLIPVYRQDWSHEHLCQVVPVSRTLSIETFLNRRES